MKRIDINYVNDHHPFLIRWDIERRAIRGGTTSPHMRIYLAGQISRFKEELYQCYISDLRKIISSNFHLIRL